QPVSCAEALDVFAEMSLLPFKTLEFRFLACQPIQILAYQSGDGFVAFGGLDARAAVGLVIDGYCDIFHSFTVSQGVTPASIQAATSSIGGDAAFNGRDSGSRTPTPRYLRGPS